MVVRCATIVGVVSKSLALPRTTDRLTDGSVMVDLVALPDSLSYADGAQVAFGFGTAQKGLSKIGGQCHCYQAEWFLFDSRLPHWCILPGKEEEADSVEYGRARYLEALSLVTRVCCAASWLLWSWGCRALIFLTSRRPLSKQGSG